MREMHRWKSKRRGVLIPCDNAADTSLGQCLSKQRASSSININKLSTGIAYRRCQTPKICWIEMHIQGVQSRMFQDLLFTIQTSMNVQNVWSPLKALITNINGWRFDYFDLIIIAPRKEFKVNIAS